MKSGIYEMSNEQYFALDAMSSSGLQALKKSPKHYRAFMKKTKVPDSEAFILGTLVHTALLEPAKFENLIWPSTHKTYTESDKAAAAALGKLPYRKKDEEFIKLIKSEIPQNLLAQTLLSSAGRNEIVLVWERDGVLCKAKLDRLLEDGTVIDIKTTSTDITNENAIEYDFRKYNYAWQTSHYLDGAKALGLTTKDDFIHMMIPKAGKDVKAEDFVMDFLFVSLTDFDISNARLEYAPLFDLYKECKQNDKWPGPKPEIKDIVLRQFA